MNPVEFAQKWRALAPHASERAAYQEHFRDLCALVGHPTPSSDTTGTQYAFEKHVKKVGGDDDGYADVWKRGYFAFEYKRRGKPLGKAFQQLVLYQHDLENPPLLVVSDLERIEVHTNFTGTARKTYHLDLDAFESAQKISGGLTALEVLHSLFKDPTALDPRVYRERITQSASAQIGTIAQALRGRGVSQRDTAHFLMRLVFCLFAEDAGLLERGLMERLLVSARQFPAQSRQLFSQLFAAMSTGGFFGPTPIRHFNGGLFDSAEALDLHPGELETLISAADLDWAEVEPSIFGTLFEQSLEAGTRSARGAHYTNVNDILRVVEPVVMVPLRREWQAVRDQAAAAALKKKGGLDQARRLVLDFHGRLKKLTVLDPACGSGNFLYVTLKQLLDLEHEVIVAGEQFGLGRFDLPPEVHPGQMLGIEVEEFAHELASVVLNIGYIQWKRAHGGDWPKPVLVKLDNIRCHDALLNADGSEYVWPDAEFIVGNPPFLGEKKQGPAFGQTYVDNLRRTYTGRVPASSDLVCYWFEKARAAIESGVTRRAGLISTNSINMPGNRRVLERINETGRIFRAWPNLPWLQDGAAVRVAAVCFDNGAEQERFLGHLSGERTAAEQEVLKPVPAIHANLSSGADVTTAKRLPENAGLSFQGVKLAGAFDLPGDTARAWLTLPNPDGANNADVLRPLLNGDDLVDVRGDTWVIDFAARTEEEARRYLVPFAHVEEHVKPGRTSNKRDVYRLKWWIHAESRPAMRRALAPLPRYLATSIVAKHRAFVWCEARDLPSGRLVVVASDQDWMYGVLNSRIHVVWANANSSTHGKGNDLTYTSTTCFETFPFPAWTPETQAQVTQAAQFLETARAAMKAQGYTLTGMLNALSEGGGSASPAYTLRLAQARLDEAVAGAYGWDGSLGDDDILTHLLALNLERASTPAGSA